MNPKYNLITVAEMLRYIAAHEKAASLNKDLTILRETAVDKTVAASSHPLGCG